MFKKWIELVVGSLDDKKQYKVFQKRVKALPKEYQVIYKRIQSYIYTVGNTNGDLQLFIELLELFETSVADGRKVVEVVGTDLAKFVDEYIQATNTKALLSSELLNQEVLSKFNKEVK